MPGPEDKPETMPSTPSEALLQVHGDGVCHICGKPKAGEGLSICSYPHGRLPVQDLGGGMAAWKRPAAEPVQEAERKPKGLQDEWFALRKKLGEPAASAHVAKRLREVANQIENGGDPSIFGCHLEEKFPFVAVHVVLSHPWGG
jgi:hypothetical protein